MSDEIRAEYLWDAARSLVQAGNGWKARDLLRQMLCAFPNHAAGRAELAAILFADGDIDGALVHCSFAYGLDPELPGLRKRMGELYFLTGFYQEANDCFERVVRSGEKDSSVVQKLAICREMLSGNSRSDEEQEQ